MNNNKFFIRLLAVKKWREWWINRLSQKPKRIMDWETQEPMILEKRIHVERPRLEDYIDFLCSFDVVYKATNVNNRVRVLLTKNNKDRILKIEDSSLRATELALLDYLKESNMEGRWA